MSRDFETENVETRYKCRHPSLKCLVCARAYDLLRPGESALVAELRAEVALLRGESPTPPPPEVALNHSPTENSDIDAVGEGVL